MKHAIWLTAILLALACPLHAEIIITEVLYDIPGVDGSLEWVELLNTGPDPVDLGGYKLGWGGTDYTYGELNLNATMLGVCEVYVVGGPLSNETNGNPVFDFAALFDPNIQNSGTTSDGVALFHYTDPFCPIDVVIYGYSNDNQLIDETCFAGPTDVGDAPSGSSIELTWLDGDWAIQVAPSPNQIPFSCGGASGADYPQVPAPVRLDQNWPNPFNPTTRLVFHLAEPAIVSFRIFDTSGHLVCTLLDGVAKGAGSHEMNWNGRDNSGLSVASGTYLYRLETDKFSAIKRMVLVR
jgi:hypothetical protein